MEDELTDIQQAFISMGAAYRQARFQLDLAEHLAPHGDASGAWELAAGVAPIFERLGTLAMTERDVHTPAECSRALVTMQGAPY